MQSVRAKGINAAKAFGGGLPLIAGLSLSLAFPLAAEAQYREWGPYGMSPYGTPHGYGPYEYYGPYDQPLPYQRYERYGSYEEFDDSDQPRVRARKPLRKTETPASKPSAPEKTAAPQKPLPLAAIESRVQEGGFRLIAPPRQKGEIYLAEVEDREAVRRRLIYNAFNGKLIENTALGPVKKKPGSAKDGAVQ